MRIKLKAHGVQRAKTNSENTKTYLIKQNARLPLGLRRKVIKHEYLMIYINGKLFVLRIIKL